MTRRRAAITGIGIVGPTGVGHVPLWEAVRAARPAIRQLRRFDATLTPCGVAGEVDDAWLTERIDARKLRTTTRATQLALVAAELAATDARLPRDAVAPEAFGVTVGTALGGWCDAEQQTAILLERGTRRVNPFVTSGAPNHGPGVEVAAAIGAQGPQFTFSSGCPAGLQALAQGAALIESGLADVCLAGGTDAPLSPMAFAALTRTNELSTCQDPLRACRPFDTEHQGMVLSEGGAFLLMEEAAHARARGASTYATVLGGTFSCDAQGLYGADESGTAAARALRHLLATTGTNPDQIDYICAHANASPFFDRKELVVLCAALGACLPRIPVSSIKGVLGHPFGASGAFQTATAALAIRDGIIPPTANLETPASECGARHVVGGPITASLQRILITSYGYGGVNGFLLVGAPEP